MSIRVESFGTLPSGEHIDRYILEGAGGMTAALLTYGATLQQLTFGGYDVVCGYDTIEGYLANGGYQGATIGRYGNRIAGGRFTLDGEEYTVPCNERGVTHLHGGNVGFDKRVWHAAVLSEGNEPAVRFSRLSPAGEEGYPANLLVSVTFTVTAKNALRIEYDAKADAPTVVNLTNHAYFRLDNSGSIADTLLWIDGDSINAVDEDLIPTGTWLDVTATAFDFREAKPIGRDIDDPHPQMLLGGGYDHNYLLNGEGFRRVMTAISPESGLKLTCFTDQPAAQLYTGNVMDGAIGKGGIPLARRSAFCFETQHCPDSPNHPAFPSTRVDAGEDYRTVTEYRLEMMEE